MFNLRHSGHYGHHVSTTRQLKQHRIDKSAIIPHAYNTRICKDCANFHTNDQYPVGSKEAIRYGYCNLFKVIDVVSGEERYVHARTIRMKTIPGVKTCGIMGDMFVSNTTNDRNLEQDI